MAYVKAGARGVDAPAAAPVVAAAAAVAVGEGQVQEGHIAGVGDADHRAAPLSAQHRLMQVRVKVAVAAGLTIASAHHQFPGDDGHRAGRVGVGAGGDADLVARGGAIHRGLHGSVAPSAAGGVTTRVGFQ